MFALVGALGMQSQGYQASQKESFTVSILDANGGVVPDVIVILMKDGKLLDQVKSGADGRASVLLSQGLITISIHQAGYMPVDQVVDTRSTSEPVVEITLAPVPQAMRR
jgi:hypothetical protein